MNYWTMQLHPNDLGWNREKELLQNHSVIGLGDWEESANQQPSFQNEMQKGDYVLIKHGGNIIALTKVIGDYFMMIISMIWYGSSEDVRFKC